VANFSDEEPSASLSVESLRRAFEFFERLIQHSSEPLNLQPWMRIISPEFHAWLKGQTRNGETVEDVYNRKIRELVLHWNKIPLEEQRRLNQSGRLH
jgi:hypothetical protein